MTSRPDPRRPWKAYAAALSAGLTALLAYADVLPAWAGIAAAVLIAALSTYLVPNPTQDRENDGG